MTDENATLLRKITSKGVVGTVEKPSKATALYRVYGIISDHEVKAPTQDGYKPSQKFEGDFEAINLKTGEVFVSYVCYLPPPFDTMLARTVKEQKAKGDGVAVQFALEVGVIPSTKGNTGYEWTTKPIRKPGAADVLSDLRSEVKALSAPKK